MTRGKGERTRSPQIQLFRTTVGDTRFVDLHITIRRMSKSLRCRWTLLAGLVVLFVLAHPLAAQHHSDHAMDESPTTQPEHAAMDHSAHMQMPGFLGKSMSREASGTAWQPESTPMPSPM